VGVRVGVAYSRNKLTLQTRRIYFRFFEVCGRFVGLKKGVANLRAIHFSYNFYSSIKTVEATALGDLWASI